jgi:Uma2 family endonuclease
MLADAQTRVGMPLDQFIREFDEQPFELIDGEKKFIVSTVAIHGALLRVLLRLLYAYELAYETIATFPDTTFVLLDKPDWVKGSRVPDIMVYLRGRLDNYNRDVPDWQNRPYHLVPDLCIEILSPGDSYSEVDAKVQHYLADGVKLVWVLDPRRRVINVYSAQHFVRLTLDDVLDGGDLLPNFSVPVRDIFPPKPG